jgi:hypothetical protein
MKDRRSAAIKSGVRRGKIFRGFIASENFGSARIGAAFGSVRGHGLSRGRLVGR